jgi:pSer/pThr/pTyr-binding forkhead associated (FHA) protein
VSSKHAHLRYEEGSLFIFDDGSLNGTFVNQERVGNVARPIRPGDRIQIGKTVFEVEAYSG